MFQKYFCRRASLIEWISVILVSGSISYIAYQIFYHQVATVANSDLAAHMAMAVEAKIDWHNYPPNFLFYWLVNYFSGYVSSLSMPPELKSLFVILSVAVGLKAALSYFFVKERVRSNGNSLPWGWILAGAAMLPFVFAVPYRVMFFGESFYYLGSFVPNVWHNSTIIASMPLCIVLFWVSLKNIESPSTKRMLWMLPIILTLLVIKPSFIFVFIIAYPLSLFVFNKKKIGFLFVQMIPVLFSLFLVYLQWKLLYILKMGNPVEGSVVVLPWAFWDLFMPREYFKYGLMASCLLPLLILGFGRPGMRDKGLIYMLLMIVSGIVLFIVFAEEGPRIAHGNFYWQIVPATYILFMLSLSSLFIGAPTRGTALSPMKIVLFAFFVVFFLVHVYYGIDYIIHYWTALNFV